jgi:flagellar biosynthesis regulator FlaF
MDALQQSDLRQLRHERNAALFQNHTLKALNEDLLKRNEQLSKELAALKSKAESKKQN